VIDRKVLLFLALGFEDLEAAAVRSVCGWTEYREDIPTVRVTTTGFRAEIIGRFGTTVRPDVLVADVRPEEYAGLAVPGGFHSHGFDEAYDPRLHALARSIHAAGGIIAAMCVGVLPVAEAGLLKDKKATTYPYSRHHDNPRRLRELGAIATTGPIEVSDRIISSAGPAQAIEVAYLLLEGVIGEKASDGVKRYMNHLSGERSPLP
jgi:4-methyl-5(b-hydroxyethyl)-thiazole monophosphate biosynthesis